MHARQLRILATLLVLATSELHLQAAIPAKPNVLLIVADDMGFSDLGCYGGEISTPNLDGLAANGLRFAQFYNTARCWPTRGALMTGYYAQQIRRDTVPGLKSGGAGTRPNWAPLLPERLRPLGYRSYHSGKWHIDGPRLKGGFDRSYSVEDHDRFFYPKRHLEDDQELPPIEPGSGYYSTTAIADHAIRCLQDHAENHASQPFFHYLCFLSPHFPLHAPSEDINRYLHRYQGGWDLLRQERWQRMQGLGLVNHPLPPLESEVGPPYHFPKALEQLGPNEVNRPLPWNSLSPDQQSFQAAKMAVHAAMIDRMDQEIGRVISQLKTMNALDNTLILFLSDNGASAEIMVRGDGHDQNAPPGSPDSFLCLGPGWSSAANTPHRRHKTWVHEGGISTPLIAHWPQGIPNHGQWRKTPAHVIDIAPTIVELAGGSWPNTWNETRAPVTPGSSLAPILQQDSNALHDSIWWLHEGHRAIRTGDWKAVRDGDDQPWELYNLRTDRGESRNLAATEPDRLQTLVALWETQWAAIQQNAKPPEE